MPWFEPSLDVPRYNSAPRRNHNNDDEEAEWTDQPTNHSANNNNNNNLRSRNESNNDIINLEDYLDIHWRANDDTSSQQQHVTSREGNNPKSSFDSFQHRVEHQLGTTLFPSLAASSVTAALNPHLYQMNRTSNNTNSHNNEGGRMTMSFSKTAQFFYPRRVMALQQYEGFFSPLDDCYTDNGDGGREESVQLDNNHCNDGGMNTATMNNSEFGLNHHHHHHQTTSTAVNGQNNIQIQPRNLFLSQQSNDTENQYHAHNDNLNSLFYSNNNANNEKMPAVQSRLRRDPTTGQLATSLRDNLNNDGSGNSSSLLGGKATSWENYSGRPLMDGNVNSNGQTCALRDDTSKKKKKSKTKRKKSKVKDGGEKSGQRIDEMFQPKSGRNNDCGGGNDDGSAKKKKPRKKKRPSLDTSCELIIPPDNQDTTTTATTESNEPKQVTLTEQDFEGMSNVMNAAQCMEGLQQFLTRVGQEKYVAWTMLFLDPLCHYRQYTSQSTANNGGGGGKRRKWNKKFAMDNDTATVFECTTPFLPSNKRYCTEKGPDCTAWNCTCDDQIRAKRGGAPLLGAMFVLNGRNEDDGSVVEENGGEKECYLLPLGPTKSCLDDVETDFSRMKSWPVNPFDCGVSLSDRWSAFEAIISSNERKMVTYNATTGLMPFYHHQFHDECSTNDAYGGSQISQFDGNLSSSQFTSCLTGTQEDGHNQFHRPANLRSIWDLRLVSWMLKPDVSDDNLEWSTFKGGFSHLVPDASASFYDGMPIISRGLMEARVNLTLLHSLYPLINEQLIRQDLLRSLEHIESPVQSILASMECRGVGFFPQRLKKVESQLSARVNELEGRSRVITQDADFLLSSPQQVSQFLYDKLKLKLPEDLVSKTKSSHRSTSEEALKAIKADAIAKSGAAPEIIDIILEFRSLNKLLTTYIRPLPKLCVRGDGKSKKTPSRIFPQWQMTAVRTGRLSCRKPNLQQLPSDTVFGVKPRDAFVPSAREGMCVFACDYSQKEVRILAHMSNDEALISLFRGDANTDIYKQMASLIRNKPAESITPKERAQFKQVTLALLYGMSPNQVAKKLSISKSAAQQTMNDFFRRFRRVKSWMEETKQLARRNGYVLTIAGRRRYLDDIRSNDNAKRSQAERQAINTVIQGSAADLMKTAMIRLSENLHSWQGNEVTTSKRPQMVLQIHDEVLLELNFNEGDIKKMQVIAVKSCCRDIEEMFNLKVPLLLKCSCGLSFGSMKEI